jgi:hypothetical protein
MSRRLTVHFPRLMRRLQGSVMCSYQRVNQTFACENSKLINGIIKGELDFQGAQAFYEGPTQSHEGSNQAP